MKLEGVGTVSVSDHGVQVGRQVDNVDGTKGALLGTDTATNTSKDMILLVTHISQARWGWARGQHVEDDLQRLGNESKRRSRSDLNTQLSTADDGAGLATFLLTLLGLALVSADNGDTIDERLVDICADYLPEYFLAHRWVRTE